MLLIFLSFFIYQSSEIVLEDIEADQAIVRYFELFEDQKIRIEALAAPVSKNTFSESYIWILDAKTREVVWELDEASFSSRNEPLYEFYDSFSLKKGNYELYFSTFSDGYKTLSSKFDLFTISLLSDRMRSSDYYRMNVVLEFRNGRELSEEVAKKYQFSPDETVVFSKTELSDERLEKIGMELLADCPISIYAIGELDENGEHDYAWITDTRDRKIVWKMSYENTLHAGGAEKNRFAQVTINLKKGHYIVTFAMDDQHSPNRWNDAEPYDLKKYGLTLLASKQNEQKIKFTAVEDVDSSEPVVKITRLRDNSYKTQGFAVNTAKEKLRVYAIGEMSRSGDMVDYSWIENAETGQIIWRMSLENTQHAGGAGKNRVFDKTLDFKKGRYVLYSVTNSRHSYNNWKDEKPYDTKGWGVQVFSTNAKAIKLFDPDEHLETIISLTRMGSSQKEKAHFTLNETTQIDVYAIGEAIDNEMTDYGFILDDAADRVVWRMKTENTIPAGGAKRNKLFRGQIELPKGTYTVFFKTDRGHAYDDWQEDAPYNPNKYGITLYRHKN